MTKRELIAAIIRQNPTTTSTWLEKFDQPDLEEYLHHLQWVRPKSPGPRSKSVRTGVLPGLEADLAQTAGPSPLSV